ncbi:hypothetical protein [Hyphobacterium sp.]|uniref:hypothetical protein n=1 Tax=Hyphobacterium sp. TaxID=2004662 RepID=UPI003BA9F6A4
MSALAAANDHEVALPEGVEPDPWLGRKQIEKAFGLTEKQVRHLREIKECPIRNVKGLGIGARQSELEAYLEGDRAKEK